MFFNVIEHHIKFFTGLGGWEFLKVKNSHKFCINWELHELPFKWIYNIKTSFFLWKLYSYPWKTKLKRHINASFEIIQNYELHIFWNFMKVSWTKSNKTKGVLFSYPCCPWNKTQHKTWLKYFWKSYLKGRIWNIEYQTQQIIKTQI